MNDFSFSAWLVETGWIFSGFGNDARGDFSKYVKIRDNTKTVVCVFDDFISVHHWIETKGVINKHTEIEGCNTPENRNDAEVLFKLFNL